MKRSEFLKRLGLGVVAIPLVPKIAAEIAENLPISETNIAHSPPDWAESYQMFPEEYYPPMREISIHEKLYKRYGGVDIKGVMEMYRETGNLIYVRGL